MKSFGFRCAIHVRAIPSHIQRDILSYHIYKSQLAMLICKSESNSNQSSNTITKLKNKTGCTDWNQAGSSIRQTMHMSRTKLRLHRKRESNKPDLKLRLGLRGSLTLRKVKTPKWSGLVSRTRTGRSTKPIRLMELDCLNLNWADSGFLNKRAWW